LKTSNLADKGENCALVHVYILTFGSNILKLSFQKAHSIEVMKVPYIILDSILLTLHTPILLQDIELRYCKIWQYTLKKALYPLVLNYSEVRALPTVSGHN